MKKLLFILMAGSLLTFVSCKEKTGTTDQNGATPSQPVSQNPVESIKPDYVANAEGMDKTVVEWYAEEYNFGTVPEGTKVTYQYKFKNTGAVPLTLTSVKASCGCTTPSYSKEPVAPGKEGFIDVSFDTTNREGAQTKTITVIGNFQNEISKQLKLAGIVEKGK